MTAKINRSHLRVSVFFLGCAAVFLAFRFARSQVAEVPFMTGRVTDNADLLSAATRSHLKEVIKAHEESSTNQIAILTLPSLEGVRLEEFAAQVLQAWKLGEKGKDNGVLLLVSPGDRRARIEVGAGLSEKLTDASADRIVRDLMAPQFQQGDYDQGIDAGIHAIIGQLEGNEQAGAEPAKDNQAKSDSSFEGSDMAISERILFGAFIFGIIGLFTVIGVMTPGVGWFLYIFLIPFWAMFPIVVVGTRGALILLIIYLVCYPVAKVVLARFRWYKGASMDLASKGIAHIGGFTLRSGGKAGSFWSST